MVDTDVLGGGRWQSTLPSRMQGTHSKPACAGTRRDDHRGCMCAALHSGGAALMRLWLWSRPSESPQVQGLMDIFDCEWSNLYIWTSQRGSAGEMAERAPGTCTVVCARRTTPNPLPLIFAGMATLLAVLLLCGV